MSINTKLKHEDTIVTRMGKGFLGERVVYRGKDLHHQLKNKQWLELFAFGITGREFSENELKLLNFIWVSTSYPDKAIWPNHITALAASSRSTASLGLSIGMTVFEASIYGGKPMKLGIDFFIRAVTKRKAGTSLEKIIETELSKHKVIFGYGRPLANIDERVPHVVNFAKELGLADGEHLKLALEVAHYLKSSKGLRINGAAITCALGADLGFSANEFHLFTTPLVIAGMPPCFIEAKENPEGSFLPIRCDRISYTGMAKRAWN